MRILLPDKSVKIVEGEKVTVEKILLGLGIRPNEVIVTLNGRLIPEDTIVGGDDELKIIRVTHGG